MIDRKKFFDHVRASGVAGKPLKVATVKSLNAILDAWETHPDPDPRHVSYTMATARHEAWHPRKGEIAPIEEFQGRSRAYGRTGFFGRGLVQLTHEENYRKAGKALGVDLVANPDLALRPDIAAACLVLGSLQGWYRSDRGGRHTLARYFSRTKDDPVGARNIINGDVAKNGDAIATIHRKFLAAIEAAMSKSPAPAPAPRSAPAPAPHVLSNWEVEALQKRLRELNFFEVGKVDGMWGTRTVAAVAAFQAHAGLPVTVSTEPTIDDATRAALASASPRLPSEERARTTVNDLRNQGSATIRNTDGIKWFSQVIGWISAAATVISFLANNYAAGEAMIAPFRPFLAWVPPWAWPLLGFVATLYLWFKAGGIEAARLQAERSGVHNGEPDPAPSPPVEHPSDTPRHPGPGLPSWLPFPFGR